MKKLAAVLIDGGHLRVIVNRGTEKKYDASYIEKIAHFCISEDEELHRAYYYDCAPYNGEVTLPVSGQKKKFVGSGQWLKDLASKNLFAVRLGVLKFRGFKPKNIPFAPRELTDDDFKPDFEQKGVDMRIGLDIAVAADTKTVQRIILITNDTDCIPAMKHARKAGLQVVLMGFPTGQTAPEMLYHTDFYRKLDAWPG